MWKPAPVFLPRVSHGQRSPWGHTESETAEVTEHARTRRGQSNTDEVVKSVGKYNREDIKIVPGTKMKNNQEFLLDTDSNKVVICFDAENSSDIIQSVVHISVVVHDQWCQ